MGGGMSETACMIVIGWTFGVMIAMIAYDVWITWKEDREL